MTGNKAKPTLCMIHEAIGNDNAIAKVSMRGVYAALDAGYDVTVVAKYLDQDLQGRVRWLRLFVPRRLFLLQWTTARFFTFSIRTRASNTRGSPRQASAMRSASVSTKLICPAATVSRTSRATAA